MENNRDDKSIEELYQFLELYQKLTEWGKLVIHVHMEQALWQTALKNSDPEKLRFAVGTTATTIRIVIIPFFWPYIWRGLLVGMAGLLAGVTIQRLLGGL